MHLVFMNSLQKKNEESGGDASQAQVSIHEEQGKMAVVWSAPLQDGGTAQDTWYEGGSWSDMLAMFQYRLAQKMAEGFVPLIEGFPEESDRNVGPKHPLVLDYYSEQHYDEELFGLLREWRNGKAKEEKRAPYLLATNRMLRMIACFVPQTKDELEQIPGFGKLRCQVYGDELVALTQTRERKLSFPLNWVYDDIDADEFRRWTFKQKEANLKRTLEQAKLRKDMLRLIGENRSIGELSSRLDISMRTATMALEELYKEGYDLGSWLQAQLARIPEGLLDYEAAVRDFRAMGDKYLKPVMQKQFGESVPEGTDLEDVYGWLRIIRLVFRTEGQQAA